MQLNTVQELPLHAGSGHTMFLLERKGNSDTDSGPSEEFTVLGVTNNGEPHNAECMQHCASAFPCEGWACPRSHDLALHGTCDHLCRGLDAEAQLNVSCHRVPLPPLQHMQSGTL